MSITNQQLAPFHLAFPVADLQASREFFVDVVGCREGRSSDTWIDFDLFGHQIVAHQVSKSAHGTVDDAGTNPVDGHDVPVPHFGVVLPWDQWHEFADRLREYNVQFVIEPCIRFQGEVGEQATMFFRDPSGNALEFKAFRDHGQLFAT